jgi:hypothetical protein
MSLLQTFFNSNVMLESLPALLRGLRNTLVLSFFSIAYGVLLLMNPLIFQRPEFGAVFSLRSGNNRAKRTNWRPAALLTTMASEHSHAAGLA